MILSRLYHYTGAFQTKSIISTIFDKLIPLYWYIIDIITGNGDVHLKNISLLETSDGDMMLSPSYDLMNTKIHLTDNLMALNLFEEFEQTNLPLGEKYKYKKADFIEFGKRLKIKETIITKIIDSFTKKEKDILTMINKSFLSSNAKRLYKNNVIENYKNFLLD